MRVLFISLYQICKYCFATTFTVIFLFSALAPFYIWIFHPQNFTWLNYWNFIKSGLLTLLVIAFSATLFNRFSKW
jgi:hypothetical protein